MKKDKYTVAVVGATGAVGNEMVSILEERNFPVGDLRLLASERSEGKQIEFKGKRVKVNKLTKDSFKGVDIALFSAGASRSLEFAPIAVKSGAVVIDNSSAFRMEPDVPLVVPEVNSHAIKKHKGIIANPNCSTIQMVVALKPIHDAVQIKRIVVSTYQAVSGTGKKAISELEQQTRDLFSLKEVTVSVPVFAAHSESVNIETNKKITRDKVKELLSKAPGVEVVDDPKNSLYPLAINSAGRDEVFVGRIREDESIDNGINMWIVSDNLRKGAALNAVQIAE